MELTTEQRLSMLERAFAAHVHFLSRKGTTMPLDEKEMRYLTDWLNRFRARYETTARPPAQPVADRDARDVE